MTTIRIYETIHKKVYDQVMPALEIINPGSTVTFKINSKGGRQSYHEPILEKVKELRYEKNCYLIAEGARFYSAAFLLFIMCNERVIVPESKGMIHLPEFSNRDLIKDYYKAQKLYKKQQEHAELICSYTGFTVDQVYLYDCFELNASQLFKFKVADKIVPIFNN